MYTYVKDLLTFHHKDLIYFSLFLRKKCSNYLFSFSESRKESWSPSSSSDLQIQDDDGKFLRT